MLPESPAHPAPLLSARAVDDVLALTQKAQALSRAPVDLHVPIPSATFPPKARGRRGFRGGRRRSGPSRARITRFGRVSQRFSARNQRASAETSRDAHDLAQCPPNLRRRRFPHSRNSAPSASLRIRLAPTDVGHGEEGHRSDAEDAFRPTKSWGEVPSARSSPRLCGPLAARSHAAAFPDLPPPSETQKLRNSETQKLRNSETPKLRNSETPKLRNPGNAAPLPALAALDNISSQNRFPR